MTIPNSIQEFIRQRADFRCEYCHYPEFLSTSPLTIDHIMPKSLGGSDDADNLALACRRCNEQHYNFIVGIDPETQQEVSLFNPRQQNWSEHFIWAADGTKIIGITRTGRATCNRLDLNDERRADRFIQKSRRLWVQGGFHPPRQDPQQASDIHQ
ncbi:HNH endonuclease [Scytonema sp. HK-05]|uniref:HNH endonuclease n=1 Tax=Scytonema sp. HK-05 TaxID=1137095 RepID=UPI000935916D|nr:HNH endonuclease signature motif containing protein [Scytonema sp. HK-05]OKH50520.1 HNH endonuclease [Scytonema sp. HK-05]BAY48573.1 HNH endonuclease [Scytonema sp. HK-05]